MRIAILSLAVVLTLLVKPVPNKPIKTNIDINTIYTKQSNTFPDRSKQAEAAHAADIAKQKAAEAALEAARQAQLAQQAQVAVQVVQAAQAAPVSSNAAKMFIYMHESGNNPAAVNGGGCRGLGQACPGSKLPCGNDYACQDAYFTNYMLGRYGSWENALAFWQSHNWW